MSEKPFRILPRVTPENEHFWHGGAQGELRFLRCRPCRTWIHPPMPLCPECESFDLAPEAVSGRAALVTYTENHHPWIPGFPPPYLVAIVEVPEQAGLRLTTNLIDCDVDSVRIGMPLRVVFEEAEDGIYLPLFQPEKA